VLFRSKTNEEIDIIKQLIAAKQQQAGNTEKQIDVTQQIVEKQKQSVNLNKQLITANRDLITAHVESKSALEQIKANNDKLLGLHNGQRGLLVEARDLTKESRDLMQKMISIMEKMEAIMMKNPAKYENMTWAEFKNRSEIKEAKAQVIQLANVIVEQYPKEESVALTDTVKNVVDATFTEIKPTDVKANMKLFNNLEKRIEAALDKKYETLAVRDQGIKPIVNAHYKSVEHFSRIKKLDYLDLALKNIKV